MSYTRRPEVTEVHIDHVVEVGEGCSLEVLLAELSKVPNKEVTLKSVGTNGQGQLSSYFLTFSELVKI